MVAGLNEQPSPNGVTVSDSVIVPGKPSSGDIVIVEVAVEPARTGEEELAEMVKSWTVTVTGRL
jgi:hypothetical protein